IVVVIKFFDMLFFKDLTHFTVQDGLSGDKVSRIFKTNFGKEESVMKAHSKFKIQHSKFLKSVQCVSPAGNKSISFYC
ncbi:MAG: hypothetical protein J7L94_15315, partial [Caldisericaceae bacterium]|nr:hypothetical protein [Caldisericaceae bacterium]